MTLGESVVLATRQLSIRGTIVRVTVGAPQRDPFTDMDFVCPVRIEGLTSGTARLQGTGRTSAEALTSGLLLTSEKVEVGLTELLSEALVGVTPHRASVRPRSPIR